MLRALGHPASFLGLLAGFVLGILAYYFAQRAMAKLLRIPAARTEQGALEYIDPYGVVAAAIGGTGWGRMVRLGPRSGRRATMVVLAGPVVLAILSVAAFAGYVAKAGTSIGLGFFTYGDAITGQLGSSVESALLCAGLQLATMALLALVPLPPLAGWSVLVLNLKPTLNWQKARYYLEERNIGVVIVLVLTALPFTGSLPILVGIVDLIVNAVLDAVAG